MSGDCRSARGAGLVALTVALLSMPLSAQTVEGHLLDGTTHEPVAAGIVSLLAEDGEVLARVEVDSAGAFVLEAPGPGSYYLRGERIGYRTKTDGVLDLSEEGRVEVDFYILPQAVELEGLEVRVEGTDWIERRLRQRLEGQGFFDRQKMGFGYFITPEEIEERPPSQPRDLFRMIPGMDTGNVTGTPGTEGLVTFDCGAFAAYVNGIRVHDPMAGSVWDMGLDISMADVAAVEVYPRIATLPIQYSQWGVCAVILVWTK